MLHRFPPYRKDFGTTIYTITITEKIGLLNAVQSIAIVDLRCDYIIFKKVLLFFR